jgi:hypothetical protein
VLMSVLGGTRHWAGPPSARRSSRRCCMPSRRAITRSPARPSSAPCSSPSSCS